MDADNTRVIELPRYPERLAGSDVWERPAAAARRQFAAQAIDAAFVLSPVALMWGSVSWHRVVSSGPDDWQPLLWLVAIVAGYAWLLLGWPLLEAASVAIGRRTLGQAVTGVRMVTSFGERVGFLGTLGRAFMASWSATAVGTVVLVVWVHWPPVVLVVAFAGACLSTASVGPLGDGWLGAASGTRLVRATRRSSYWDQRAS